MKIIDNLATKIADKVNAQNDEVMSLTQENELLRQKLAASELTISDYQGKIKQSDAIIKTLRNLQNTNESEIERLENNNKELGSRLKDLSESGERQVDVIQECSERILELENEVKALSSDNADYEFKINKLKRESSKELRKQVNKLTDINSNQLKFIEILQTLSSSKSDKTKLTEIFSHNLKTFVNDKNLTHRQAAELFKISKTTIGTLISGKTNLTYDYLDILDSKMCDYFECSVYELVTRKMEGKENRVK